MDWRHRLLAGLAFAATGCSQEPKLSIRRPDAEVFARIHQFQRGMSKQQIQMALWHPDMKGVSAKYEIWTYRISDLAAAKRFVSQALGPRFTEVTSPRLQFTFVERRKLRSLDLLADGTTRRGQQPIDIVIIPPKNG